MSRFWIIVATLLCVTISVCGECLNSTQMAAKAQSVKSNAANARQGVRDAANMIGPIGAAALAGSGVGAPLAPFFLALGPVTSFITGLADMSDPKEDPSDKTINCLNDYMNNITSRLDNITADLAVIKEMMEQVLPAINELRDLISDKFAALEKKIDSAVSEIKTFQTAVNWKQTVTGRLKELRDSAIVLNIWTLAASGCKGDSKKVMLQARKLEDGELPDICLSDTYIKNAQYSHASANSVSHLILGSLIELLFYQAMCAGVAFKTNARIDVENQRFLKIMEEISNEYPKIIKESGESYWPGPAYEYAVSLMDGPGAWHNSKRVYDAFNERYTWYKHQVFFARGSSRKPMTFEGSQDYEIGDNLRIDKTENQRDENDIVIVTRHRIAPDPILEKEDVERRSRKFADWLSRNVPFSKDSFCGICDYNPETKQGCNFTTDACFQFAFAKGIAESGYNWPFDRTKDKIVDSYGDFASFDRNHAHIIIYGAADNVINYLYSWGDCGASLCYRTYYGSRVALILSL
ncbi:hypothetical protein DdX_21804 [Ditylenchus destructor]|uniref:Uncharacterized protein n=1 Tax=Ditylenchus destructor TaxID=166010 RepID=A0AAD4MGQ1_9BILA|nr:hypothetical protein DdX_21804 [Ditylenchus destructor]